MDNSTKIENAHNSQWQIKNVEADQIDQNSFKSAFV